MEHAEDLILKKCSK